MRRSSSDRDLQVDRRASDYAAAMRFIEAAEEVLRREGRPLTTKEITELALARGLIETQGKTPEATMSAALYGASAAAPIRREFQPGRARAIRGSVRWTVVKPARTSRTR